MACKVKTRSALLTSDTLASLRSETCSNKCLLTKQRRPIVQRSLHTVQCVIVMNHKRTKKKKKKYKKNESAPLPTQTPAPFYDANFAALIVKYTRQDPRICASSTRDGAKPGMLKGTVVSFIFRRILKTE